MSAKQLASTALRGFRTAVVTAAIFQFAIGTTFTNAQAQDRDSG